MNTELVKEIISKENHTLYWLSKQSGIPYTTLHPIVSGKRKPMFETVIKIAAALDVTTDSLR